MGFYHNPYKHIELLKANKELDYDTYLQGWIDNGFDLSCQEEELVKEKFKEHNTPRWVWYCHNCGAMGSGSISEEQSIKILRMDWEDHLVKSHNANPIDFTNWT